MINISTCLRGLALLAFSSAAYAHPGHGLDNAYAGFMHPLSGWDHTLVMLAVGLWAGRIGGALRWQLPLTFLLLMLAGAVAGMLGLHFPGVETGIAASVLAMGILLALHVPLNFPVNLGWRFALTALFAVFHGMAHGTELSWQQGWPALGGMLVATALLHGLGLWLTSSRLAIAQSFQRIAGGLMALAGLWLLIA